MTELDEIMEGLEGLLVGKNMRLTITAALSIACTSAFLLGIPKLELQKMLMRMYDARIAEKKSSTSDPLN